MRDPLQWSFPLGRLFGAAVRVHVTLPVVLLGLYLKALSDFAKIQPPVEGVPSAAAAVMGLLLLSILLHEYGHVFAARLVGGDCEEVLLWPLGGLAFCDLPPSPRAHLLTALGGPLVNLALCVLSASLLIGHYAWPPLNPFTSGFFFPKLSNWHTGGEIEATWYLMLAARLFVINWMLFLLNLLPAFPLDGGRMLHAILWSRGDEREATGTTAYVGFAVMLILCVVSIALNEVLLFALSLFVYVNCRLLLIQVETGADETSYGSEFGAGSERESSTTRRPAKANPIQRWLRKRAARRAQLEQQQRESEEGRMDQLLDKVQRSGLQSLTEEERRFLNRVSARYRNNQS